MRLFGKKKNSTGSDEPKSQDEGDAEDEHHVAKTDSNSNSYSKRSNAPADSTRTLAMVPSLIQDLANSGETSGDKPASALRTLFALSEHSSDGENRIKMVRLDGANLVPVLLKFLQRCAPGSSEQYLALLVLNNISIPSENKRLIALDCSAAQIFCRLLFEDPSCHLMAIILVNLTFADAELRKELVAPTSKIELVETLSYALRVSALTPEEYIARQPMLDKQGASVKVLLSALLDEDRRLRTSLSGLDYNAGSTRSKELLMDPAKMVYPETARWCLSAIKNLTRPARDSPAPSSLIETGILPLIMNLITVVENAGEQNRTVESLENRGSGSSSSDTPTPAMPPVNGTRDSFINSPTRWDSTSVQDAALFVIMNLAASETSREAVRGHNAVQTLSLITAHTGKTDVQLTYDESRQLDFQSLKARMAIAYLVGSEGHFGQPRGGTSSVSYSTKQDSVILLSETEAFLLVELLANTLSQRAKEGPGGYSAATFNVKWVLFAVSCLLTHSLNQVRFINSGGARLNALLIKALALHSVKGSTSIDADAAQYAAFSLYIQSNYGFSTIFLPALFASESKHMGKGSLSAKVFASYLRMESITPAGKHAAEQLLLRLYYLKMSGSLEDLSTPMGLIDYGFDPELLAATETIEVDADIRGAKPCDNIFDRPILRSRVPKKGDDGTPWDNRASVSSYPCALIAVQHLSFGSTKVRHMEAIDDILIANNIANSANGEKTESYNFWWSWQDAAEEIQRNLERQRSYDTSSIFSGKKKNVDETGSAMSFFAFPCVSLCGTDTTTDH